MLPSRWTDDGNDLVDENGDVIQVESPAFRIFDDPCTSFDVRDLDPTIASCGPGQEAKKRYLLAHGDDVADCTEAVEYDWNESVKLESPKAVELKSGAEPLTLTSTDSDAKLTAPLGSIELESKSSSIKATQGPLDLEGGNITLTAGNEGTFLTNNALRVTSKFADVTLQANSGAEKVERDIADDASLRQITNKQYVDRRDDLLRQDIIELEEEINAIAPSLEYGSWKYEEPSGGNVTRPPSPGTFYLMDGATLVDKYGDTTVIKIHNDEFVAPGDTDPVDTHTWADADIGELIQLFDAADPDFLLGKITGKTVDPVGEFVTLTIDRIQSSGVPDDNLDPITNVYLTRVNIFKEPSGGTASDFVLKSGDTMPGPNPLTIKTTKTSNNYNSPGTNTAYIKFENDNSGSTRTLSLFKAGPDSTLVTDGGFMARGSVWSSGDFYAYNGTTTVNPRMVLGSSEGKLAYGNSAKLTWQSDGVKEIIAKGIDGDKGMVLKRDRDSSNRIEWSGVVDINTSSSNRCVGELWYNNNDGVLYLRIS